MKKIVILALHLSYGGITSYISSLCKMLDSDYEIEIISTYKMDKEVEFSNRVKITYLMKFGPNRSEFIESLKSFRLVKTFIEGLKSIKILFLKNSLNKKAVSSLNCDYVITTMLYQNKIVNKYCSNDIVRIGTEHSYCDSKIDEIVRSLSNFDYFISISKGMDKLFRDKLNDRCVYIPNTIDEISVDSSKLDNNNLIAIGRLHEVKGFRDLIDVLRIVKKSIPSIKLNLVGDGELYKELSSLVVKYDLVDNVKLHGFLNRDDINKLFYDSSLYVMTSYSESFGLVMVEAMSYGVPCIGFDSSSGAIEIISNNGVLISNRDKEKMANEIVKLLNNKNSLLELGSKSKEFSRLYDINNVKSSWLELLRKD